MNSRNIVIGALAGLAIGTLIGALSSTTTAATITSKARKKGKSYADGLKKAFSEAVDVLSEKAGVAKEEGEDLLKQGRTEANRLKNKAESLLH